MTVGPRAARVRRWPQLAQEAQLLERRLELRARLRPLDALQRAERRLDRGSLPSAGEVRPEPRAEVACTTDVERQALAAVEDVDAGPRRRAGDERALHVQPPGAGRGELDEVGERPRAALLREPEQAHEDLRRGLRVGERPVARRGRDAEEVRERREPEALVRSASSRFASQTVSTTGAAMRRPVRSSTSRSRKARSKRALCATSAASPANARKRRIASSTRGAPRSAGRLDAGERGHRRPAAARAGRRASRRCPRARARGRAARRSRRSASCAASGRSSRGRRRRSARRSSWTSCPEAPRARPRLRARRAARRRRRRRRAASGRAPSGRSRARRGSAPPRRRDRPAPRLDELHEPVGGVERELHAARA